MSDMIYRLVLKAQYESAEELERAVSGLERLQMQGAKVSVKMGEAGRVGAVGLDSVARSTLRLGFMVNMLESAYMRQTMAQLMATNAQERYNTVVERYGVNSEEARKAAKQLEMQMQYLNIANTRAYVSQGLLLTQFALQCGILDKVTQATIVYKAAVAAATVKEWLHVAALQAKALWKAIASGGVLLPVLLAAGAAATVGLGAYAATQLASKSEITINTNLNVESDLDSALTEQNRRIKTEYESLKR